MVSATSAVWVNVNTLLFFFFDGNMIFFSLNPVTMELDCYNAIFSELKCTKDSPLSQSNILSPELAIPVCTGNLCSRSHCAINMLGESPFLHIPVYVCVKVFVYLNIYF